MLIPLTFAPGLFRNGTRYQAKGRWYDANLVRFFEGAKRPIGGWVPLFQATVFVGQSNGIWSFVDQLSERDGVIRADGSVYAVNDDTTLPDAVNLFLRSGQVFGSDEITRALLAWRDGDNIPRLALGTNLHLLQFSEGVLLDLTPADLVTGNVDTTSSIGDYGSGAYGVYNYGEGDTAQASEVPAATWQLDTLENDLVAVLDTDGRLFYWDNASSTLTAMSGAPTNNTGIVVTAELFVVALGAGGDPRLIQWASQETFDTWTPDVTNSAGSLKLPGQGRAVCGRRSKGETLIWTDADLFSLQYEGGQFIYGLIPLGRQCGIVSPNAVAMLNDRAIWMGQKAFYEYTGIVRPLPSEVSDYVFGDFNQTQRVKVCATTVAQFGEVWWFYPSSGSDECNRYVIYNYKEDHWNLGALNRTAAIDRGVFAYPIMAAPDAIYQHEQGTERTDAGTPYLESGPLELGDGDRLLQLTRVLPDESRLVEGQVLGSTQLFLYPAIYPDQEGTALGPFTLGNPTTLRATARQIRVRHEEVEPGDWRLGTVRVDALPSSRR